MNVFSMMDKYSRTVKSCTLNTGTLFDLATGNFLPGKNGQMILNGGLHLTNSVAGRPQTYKSSIMLGYFTRVLQYYRRAHGLCYETEMSLNGIERVIALGSRYADRALLGEDGNPRMIYYDKTELALEDLFEVTRSIAKEKEANKKDLIVETPFIDDYGKFIKAWVPTIIAVDSWSAASSSKEISLYNEHNVGDSKTNMVNMYDGKIKSDFARQIPGLCGARGIYFITTAHIGDNNNLDPYSPPAKDLPMMSAKDKLKNCGTQYKFLSTNMLQTRKVTLMQDDKKKCQYPTSRHNSDVELQMITSHVTRCKNNVSGASFDHISSQFEGIQEYLEYYQLIKDTKCALLEGAVKQKLSITDHEFTRLTLRDTIDDDYTFRRALEILAQFCFIRNRWNIPSIKNLGYVEFSKMINSSAALKEEILNSTGVWSFIGDEGDRPYMSILDIVERVSKVK